MSAKQITIAVMASALLALQANVQLQRVGHCAIQTWIAAPRLEIALHAHMENVLPQAVVLSASLLMIVAQQQMAVQLAFKANVPNRVVDRIATKTLTVQELDNALSALTASVSHLMYQPIVASTNPAPLVITTIVHLIPALAATHSRRLVVLVDRAGQRV
jgi:hypothetical protein